MVKIITDSGCDLPGELIKKLNIDVISLNINCGDEEFKDKVNLTSMEIFKRQRNGENFQTSQVSTYDFLTKFESMLQENQEFIYISLSSGLSGCYSGGNSVLRELKEKYKNVKCSVIDSKSATVAQGMIVKNAAIMAKNRACFETIIDFIEEISKNINHIFTVFDMEYLCRGGRISKTSMIVGNFLNIRPVIVMDREGKLKVAQTVRGDKKAIKTIIECIKKEVTFPYDNKISIVYGENKDLVKPLLDEFKTDGSRLGSVIGAHTGPDIIGASYINGEIFEKYKEYLEIK